MAFCSNCGAEIVKGVKFCPSCGASLSTGGASRKSNARKSNGRTSSLVNNQPAEQSIEDSVRRATTQYDYNKKMSNLYAYEVSAIACAAGAFTDSLWVAVGVFLGLIVLLMIPAVSAAFCFILGIAWGVVGYIVGGYIFGSSASLPIAIAAAIAGLGANLAGRQYFEDL